MTDESTGVLADVELTLTNRMATHRIDLERLVAMPSVGADPTRAADLRTCAEAVRDLFAARGCDGARLLEVDGGPPAVYAEWAGAGDDRPTVLCYAHYDVQPTGPVDEWTSPPFEATERDGRLYGRGTADDKGGVMVHVAAIDAWLAAHDRLPVNVKVLIEGEEELGSPNLAALLDHHRDTVRSDVVVVADSGNPRVGVPGLTTSLRGLIDCVVEVRALDHGLHSGMYGGAVPDPVAGLMKLVAAMTDDRGALTVPGLSVDGGPGVDGDGFDLAAFRRDAGLLDGVELIGDPDAHVLERLWHRPTLTVIGVDATSVAEASNTVAPAARAMLSVRLAPGQDPDAAMRALVGWLEDHAPWGLQVTVEPGARGAGYLAAADEPAVRAARRALSAAWDAPAELIGIGGSIPLVEPLTDMFGGIPALLTGVGDPDTRQHGIDESLHLDDWRRECLAQAYLLHELAGTG